MATPTPLPRTVKPDAKRRPRRPVPSSPPLTDETSAERNIAERTLVRWLFFGVLVTALPIVIGLLAAMTISKGAIDLASLVKHGELLIVSVAISGAAAGEIAFSGALRGSARQYLLLGSVVLLAFIAIGWYACVVVLGTVGQDVNVAFVSFGSIAVFVMAVVAGWAGVYFAGRQP